MAPSKEKIFQSTSGAKMRYRQSFLLITFFVIFLTLPLFESHAEANDDSYQYSRKIFTWVPPYGRDDTLALLKKMFPEDAREGVRQYGMADGITHLGLQFWSVDDSGLVRWDKYGAASNLEIDEFRKWSHINGIKVLMCIEAMGADKWAWAKSHYSGNEMSSFVSAIVQEVENHLLDGVDIDFEAPLDDLSGDEKVLFLSFMKELSDQLHANGKILTCAIFPAAGNIPNPTWYEDSDMVQGLLSITDGIEVMGYESTGIDQPCYSESFYNDTEYALKVPATSSQGIYTESDPDSNGSIMNSELLEYDSIMIGNIDNIADVDFFHFISQETSDNLRIQLSTLSSNTHWKLTVMDISGNVLKEKNIGTLSYDVNSDIVEVNVVEGQRYYVIIERVSFYIGDSSYADQESKIIDPSLRSKLLLGLPSWLNEWCMSETNMMEHLRWFTENQSDTGVAIWDARLAHPDWQSHEVWELLHNFKYQVNEGNDLIPLQRAVTSLGCLANVPINNGLLRDTDGDNRISLTDTILELQNSILSEEICSQDNLIKCLDKESCFSAGGYWDNTSECVTVPTVDTFWGQVWMDRNLGAVRAKRYDDMGDEPEIIGDLYQWGRMADGHQKRNSSTINNLSSSDKPDHGLFILLDTMSYPFDWRVPPNGSLWQGGAGLNNPCPAGFRLPTIEELTVVQQQYLSWPLEMGDFPLSLIPAGIRSCSDGTGGVHDTGWSGFYWSSDVNSNNFVQVMMVDAMGMMTPSAISKAYGASVRCIKD